MEDRTGRGSNLYFHLTKLSECIVLSLLWLLTSAPVITMGAASAALYYTSNKVIKNGIGHVSREYWKAFKSVFRQATLTWLAAIALLVLLCFEMWFINAMLASGGGEIWIYVGLAIILAIVLILLWLQYVFPYMARFQDSFGRTLKNTAILCIAHFFTSLLLLLILVLMLVIPMIFTILIPVALALFPSLYALISNVFLEKVFSRYLEPDEPETKNT